MRRGVASGLAASPTMVGAVTVMIVIVAVFLAYNANTGLPFVPSYRISAEVPNANSLVPGNEVRIGGVRVGLVEAIEPQAHDDGTVSAVLDLKLDSDLEPLPDDSTMIVRARSALGLKYLEIAKGSSSEGYAQGATVPLSSYGSPDPDDPSMLEEPVEIDQVLSTFDAPTRRAIQENLVEFGNALAGRGPALNSALGRLPRVLRYLEPVMTNLSAPDTRLERFISASAAAAAEVAPVAEVQAELFVNLDSTFTALAGSHARSSRRRSPRLHRPSPSPSARCRRSGLSSTTAPSCSPSSNRGSTRSPATPRRSPIRSKPGRRS